MDAYTSFAQVYDLFMDNVPYEQWSAFLCRILKKYGIEDGPVLDLGCGTGKLTRLMAKAGYDMTGVDSSAEMLQIALSQTGEEEILYLLQEMQELDVFGRYTVLVTASIMFWTKRNCRKHLPVYMNILRPAGYFFLI